MEKPEFSHQNSLSVWQEELGLPPQHGGVRRAEPGGDPGQPGDHGELWGKHAAQCGAGQ